MIKVVIIGAGSAIFAKNLLGDMILLSDIPLREIALVDIHPEKLHVMEQVIRKMVEQSHRQLQERCLCEVVLRESPAERGHHERHG